VVRHEALPKLATILLSAPLRVKECAAATLHNVAFTGGGNRVKVARTMGVVRGLAVLLGEGLTENSKLQAAAALTSIVTVSSARGEEPQPHANITEGDRVAQSEAAACGALHILIQLLSDTAVGPFTKEHSLLALRSIVFQHSRNLQLLATSGGIPPLVAQLRHGGSDAAPWHAAAVLHSLGEHEDIRAAVASALGCEPTQVALEAALRREVTQGQTAVAHAAGPFAQS